MVVEALVIPVLVRALRMMDTCKAVGDPRLYYIAGHISQGSDYGVVSTGGMVN